MYDEVRAHLKEMLDLGAIKTSQSPRSSAILLFGKKIINLGFVKN